MELLSTGFTAEVSAHAIYLFGNRLFAHLSAVVAGDTLEAQTVYKILLEQQLATCSQKKLGIILSIRTDCYSKSICFKTKVSTGELTGS